MLMMMMMTLSVFCASDCSIYKDGALVHGPVSGVTCGIGDKLICGIERKGEGDKEDASSSGSNGAGPMVAFFCKNDERVS